MIIESKKSRWLIFFLPLLLSFIAPPATVKVYLAGDSTMAEKKRNAYPETGWGMPFSHFFDSTVAVENFARNGRSTKTFIAENLWNEIFTRLNPGDYVFIQFGHNDEVPTKSAATTQLEFEANLRRFIIESRSKNAIPVLLTPVARRKFNEVGNIQETHAAYASIIRKLSAELMVPLIDMDKDTQVFLQQLGPVDSKRLFNHLEPGENPNYPDGIKDDTHLNELGARKFATMALMRVKSLKLELANRIIKPVLSKKNK
ncbi:rhamnogalacturonan acetylesterase [Pedobacter aquatilis]|uniref:rhamnogalacturonan acetylesterase n=1 Tax=Pedobacter aquatilis TaxID=351343 RepID=UPI0029316ADD|nr:rhamnogalacturonan acetylesterase [Pedobacter aquatilis]